MIKRSEIIEAIHEGVFSAHEDFELLEGGSWIADQGIVGIEGFLASEIFLAVNQRMESGERPIFELPFDYIKRWSEAQTRGRPRKGMTPGRRVDIALTNKQGKPVHLIEVKRKWVKAYCEEDIYKLRDLLLSFGPLKGGSLKSGFLSVYYQGTNQPFLNERMDEAEEYIRNLDLKGIKVRFHRKVLPEGDFIIERYDGKEWKFGSHIIELPRQNKKNT